ncbi:MAG: Hpt domain-containing protein, partial [Gammaproteobacteria bacterium]|nr:Hpt domain-containing protein [Gammaproteobacteria bacterium]
ESERLAGLLGLEQIDDPAALEHIAASLLDVEDMLDRELVAAVKPEQESGDASLESNQYRHVTQAVMRECIVNLAKIKEIIVKVLDDPNNLRSLDQVGPQLRGIIAGLLMLNKNKAVNIIERIGTIITTRLEPNSKLLKPNKIERLADAIVSIEYYMETIALGRADPNYMLDNASRCIELLEKVPAAEKKAPEPEPAAAPPPEPAQEKAPLSVMEVDEERSEPELVEIFIEEAKEEIGKIRTYLPRWLDQPQDNEALIAVRRSFHTLKGSGRVVGAQLLGEFAWSIENLLNRIINKTLVPERATLEFVGEAAGVLPALIEQLEIGIKPDVDVSKLILRAEALAEGRSEDETQAEIESLDAAAQEADAGAPMDPVLQQIFIKEVRAHLVTIREFADRAAAAPPPVAIDEPVYRACHTLYGSAKMANCEPAIKLAAPLDRHLRARFEAEAGLSAEAVAVLTRFADEIDALITALEAGETREADAELIRDIDELSLAEASPAPAEAEPAEPASTASESAPAAQDDAYDPEIAAIFCDEAGELLDQAETALQALRAVPGSDAASSELKRLLHTLKGGARMAGITAMGDLSHALETVLPSIAAASEDADSEGMRLAQQGLDRLQQMRDAVDSGHAAQPADDLLARFERLGHVDEPAAGVTEPPGDETRVQPAIDASAAAAADGAAEAGASLAPHEDVSDETRIQPAGDFEQDADSTAVEPEPTDQFQIAQPVSTSTPAPQPAPAAPPLAARAERAETARVDSQLLDELLNQAGEISIFQSRLNQQVRSIEFHLGE